MTNRPRKGAILGAALIAAVVLGACGSGGEDDAQDQDGATPTTTVDTLTAEQADRLGFVDEGDEVTAIDPSVTVPADEAATPTTTASTATDDLQEDILADVGLDSGDGPADYDAYVTRSIPGSPLTFEAPAEWTDLQTGAFLGGSYLTVSPNLTEWEAFVGTGTNATTGPTATPEQALRFTADQYLSDHCTPGEVRPYDDGRLTGFSQSFTACDGSGTAAVTAVAGPGISVVFDTTFVEPRDIAALARALQTVTTTAG